MADRLAVPAQFLPGAARRARVGAARGASTGGVVRLDRPLPTLAKDLEIALDVPLGASR